MITIQIVKGMIAGKIHTADVVKDAKSVAGLFCFVFLLWVETKKEAFWSDLLL